MDYKEWIRCIKRGEIDKVKKNYKQYWIHVHDDYAFRDSCCYGHIEIAKWLYSLGSGNINAYKDDVFIYSCYTGQIEITKWLYSVGADIYSVKTEYIDKYELKEWIEYVRHQL